MPPLDLTRSYYRRPANARQSVVAVLIEHWRPLTAADMSMEQPAKVTTTAIILRQANTALILAPHANVDHARHHPCHYRHSSHQPSNDYPTSGTDGTRYNHHKYHHHHHYHEHHAMPHHSTASAWPAQSALGSTNIAGLAATELGFLAISLALSILLLLVGYKIGDRVCKYELLHNRDRGCGHKSSRARLQKTALLPLSDEKQPIFLEEDGLCAEHHDDPELVPEPVQIVTEPRAAWTYK